jgi:hypothetical protein
MAFEIHSIWKSHKSSRDEQWAAGLRDMFPKLEQAMASGLPPGRELKTFFGLLPCYNPNNPYVYNVVSMFHRRTGAPERSWEWIRRSLMTDPTPEAYHELMLWYRDKGDKAQADVVKGWLRTQLEASGLMTDEWSRTLAN